MNGVDLRLSTRDGALVAELTGEVDLSNAERLGDRIAEAVDADHRGVVIDLGKVGFLDSVGIYVLIGLSQRLSQRGQAIALVVPEDAPVLGTLRVSNVHPHLPICDGIDAALDALTRARSDT